MNHKAWMCLFSFLNLVLILSCGRPAEKESFRETPESCLSKSMMLLGEECVPRNGDPGISYQTFLMPGAPFIQSLGKDEIEVCVIMQSEDAVIQNHLEQSTRKAFAAWIEPLQFVSYNLPDIMNFHFGKITKNVVSIEFPAEEFCQRKADLTVVHLDTLKQVFGEDRAFATENKIWLSKNQNAEAIILHEFGHIMGLNDTYLEEGGGCRKGFGDSIMCKPYNWPNLRANDWVGAQRSYCMHTEGAHPNCFNHEKSELLSFFPKLRGNFSYTSYNSYFFCHNKDFNLAFSPFQFSVSLGSELVFSSPEAFELLSTDRGSLTESFSDNGFEFTFKIDNRKMKNYKDRRYDSIVMKLEGNSLTALFPYKGEWYDQVFTSCAFDDTASEYLASRNIDVGEAFVANRTYTRLLMDSKNRLETPHSGTGVFTAGIKAEADTKPDSISVYAGAEPVLLVKKPFDEIARITGKLEEGYLIDVDMKLVPSSTEDLDVFVEGQGAVLLHARLKKNRTVP